MSWWSKLGQILLTFGLRKLEKELDERLDDDKKEAPVPTPTEPISTPGEQHQAVTEAAKNPVPQKLEKLELRIDGSGGFLFKPSDHHSGVVVLLPGNFPVAHSVWLEGKGGRVDAVRGYTFMANPDKHGPRQHWRWYDLKTVVKTAGKKPNLHVRFSDGTVLTFHLNKGLNHRYD